MKYGKGRIGAGEAGNGRAGNGFLPDTRSADGCINCRLMGPGWKILGMRLDIRTPEFLSELQLANPQVVFRHTL